MLRMDVERFSVTFSLPRELAEEWEAGGERQEIILPFFRETWEAELALQDRRPAPLQSSVEIMVSPRYKNFVEDDLTHRVRITGYAVRKGST